MALVVKPISAMLTKDLDLFGKMDPYVVCIVGQEKKRTKAHSGGGKKPQWTDTLVFNTIGQMMRISVYDDDYGKDDFVGEGTYNLNQLYNNPNRTENQYIDLVKNGRSAGRVLISFQYQGTGGTGGGWNNQPNNWGTNNGWGPNNNGWGNGPNYGGWGNNGPNNGGWGNNGPNYNWGNKPNNGGWGNNGPNNGGWGNYGPNNGGWGNNGPNNGGWGNNGPNNGGWGNGPNNGGWGNNGPNNGGWGNNGPNNGGWGNNGPNNGGWGNNGPNNGWNNGW